MSEKKQTEIKPPIEVNGDIDPNIIGKHYANLHQAETGNAYEKLGIKISTRYITEKLPDGKTVVRIIEDRE